MSSGYHQIPMHENSIKYTAFTVPRMGRFECTRVPLGLSGALGTFQELMDRIIGPELEPYAFCYLDDIILATDSYKKHMEVLEEMLIRMRDANLTINKEKICFCASEAKYLGFIVDRDGFRPDPEKVSSILQIPAPTNVKQLKKFLGSLGWYRKFIENFLTIAEPLNQLTCKKAKYEWSDAQPLCDFAPC